MLPHQNFQLLTLIFQRKLLQTTYFIGLIFFFDTFLFKQKKKSDSLLLVLLQTHSEKLAKVYQPLRSALANRSKISVAHLLAARQDFSKILRTSSGKIREKTACAINKVGSTQCSHNIFSVSYVLYKPF